jgi:hypothetical protein
VDARGGTGRRSRKNDAQQGEHPEQDEWTGAAHRQSSILNDTLITPSRACTVAPRVGFSGVKRISTR